MFTKQSIDNVLHKDASINTHSLLVVSAHPPCKAPEKVAVKRVLDSNLENAQLEIDVVTCANTYLYFPVDLPQHKFGVFEAETNVNEQNV